MVYLLFVPILRSFTNPLFQRLLLTFQKDGKRLSLLIFNSLVLKWLLKEALSSDKFIFFPKLQLQISNLLLLLDINLLTFFMHFLSTLKPYYK